jgi:single-stranded-DNA-specific exonuclease
LGRAADDALGKLDLSPVLNLDAQVSVKSLVGDTYRWLKDLEPYGVGNPAPVFLTRGMQVLNARPVGGNGQHLRMKLKEGGAVWDAIAFRQAEQWHEDAGVVDVVYTPGTQWKGTTQVINLKVLDLRPSGS